MADSYRNIPSICNGFVNGQHNRLLNQWHLPVYIHNVTKKLYVLLGKNERKKKKSTMHAFLCSRVLCIVDPSFSLKFRCIPDSPLRSHIKMGRHYKARHPRVGFSLTAFYNFYFFSSIIEWMTVCLWTHPQHSIGKKGRRGSLWVFVTFTQYANLPHRFPPPPSCSTRTNHLIPPIYLFTPYIYPTVRPYSLYVYLYIHDCFPRILAWKPHVAPRVISFNPFMINDEGQFFFKSVWQYKRQTGLATI